MALIGTRRGRLFDIYKKIDLQFAEKQTIMHVVAKVFIKMQEVLSFMHNDIMFVLMSWYGTVKSGGNVLTFYEARDIE